MHFFQKKFAHVKNFLYLCTRFKNIKKSIQYLTYCRLYLIHKCLT